MKSLFLFSVFVTIALFSYGQTSHLDSLLEKGNALLYENPKEAIALVEPVLLSGDEDQIFEACNLMGDCHYFLGELDEAMNFYQRCLKIGEAHLDDHKIGIAYYGIGSIYSDNGNPDLAFEYYFKALEIHEKEDDKLATANVLNNIAVLFSNQGKYDKALNYMHQVNQIDVDLQDSVSMGFSFSNLGGFHYLDDNYDSAMYYHDRALTIRTAMGNRSQMSRSMNSIANVLVRMGDLPNALTLYEQAIEIRRSLNNEYELARSLNNIGESLLANEKYGEAYPYLIEANEILDSMGNSGMLLDNSLTLAWTYSALGKHKDAYEMMFKTYELRRKMYDEAKSLQTEEMMAKFETEKTEKENEGLRAEQAEQSLTIEKSKNRVYLLIGGASILGLLAILILGKLRSNRKNTKTLRGLYDQLEEKNSDIVDSINYAKRIQKAILPPLEKFKGYLPKSFIFYRPKDVVAGDFYWMKDLEDKILFAVADCTGHGVPGAMVSVVCNNALNRAVHEDGLVSPDLILNRTREIVQSEFGQSKEEVKDGMDIALCLLEKNQITFSGAHNPLWVIRKGDFDVEEDAINRKISYDEYTLLEIKGDKQPVGKFDFGKDFQSHQIELQKGDMIYLFSDGYMDQFGGESEKKFKSGNFKKLLVKIQPHEPQEQKELLSKAFEDWKGELEQLDDVCVIGVRV